MNPLLYLTSLRRHPHGLALTMWFLLCGATVLPFHSGSLLAEEPVGLQRVQFNHPGLTVDLGVGLWAWPLPMDFDGDGDLDLVVSCPDVPFQGTYFFENPSTPAENTSMPVFKRPVRLGPALKNAQISYVDGKPRVLTPAKEWTGVERGDLSVSRTIYQTENVHPSKVRANQWRYVDWEADGDLDLIVGVGDWTGYGWDNAFDEQGRWVREPLHGFVYLLENQGSTESPDYATPEFIQAGGKRLDVFGMPSPNFGDFDGDGDLDLVCGEFLDGFTYFQNVGSRSAPRLAEGQRLTRNGQPLTMDLQMITPTAVDWDSDGDLDLIVGDEDGRVAWLEHTGEVRDGVPQFQPPRYFQQEAGDLKFGALITPVSVDWDSDGDEDLVCGNSAGNIGWFENLDGGNPPRWSAPRYLEAGGETFRVMAGQSGSIQGPAEAKWGYTTFDVADWNDDGKLDIVFNSIWGRIEWLENVGTQSKPELAAPKPVKIKWPEKPQYPTWNWWKPGEQELVTQWRTTPLVEDWDRDGLQDLVMLDHEGYLAWFPRRRIEGQLVLEPGRRIFKGSSYDHRHAPLDDSLDALLLNGGEAGRSGRRKLCIVDWDLDGRRDVLVNSLNISLLHNSTNSTDPTLPTATEDASQPVVKLTDAGPLDSLRLAGHTTSPTTVDWDGDGVRDLLVGAEDGRLYYLANPFAKTEKLELPGLSIRAHHVVPGRLANDQRAYANRDYVWYDVPPELQDWHVLTTFGGERGTVSAVPTSDSVDAEPSTARNEVWMATSAGLKVPSEWKDTGLSFGYTDKGRTRMRVYRREADPGVPVILPQFGWTGGLLLVKPAR